MDVNFLTSEEQLLADELTHKGYIIRPVADVQLLEGIQKNISAIATTHLGLEPAVDAGYFLNHLHEKITVSELNDLRMQVIREINKVGSFRKDYFTLSRAWLESLVGNELAMQMRVNLSIQLPGDESSLLPIHADVWSGDSPYEVVAWLPLVDCYKTKTMYILPATHRQLVNEQLKSKQMDSQQLFEAIESELDWLEVRFGEVVIFNQNLPHGNIVNAEAETRWSMNCRFKSVFTPYNDKKLGEFFEPITLRATSMEGLQYRLPEVFQ